MSANQQAAPSKKKRKIVEGTYFTHFGRLYYVVDVNWPKNTYLIENCDTLTTTWMTAEFLQIIAKEVKIIDARDSVDSGA